MRKLKFILLTLLALLPARLQAEELDMDTYLFSHINDAYSWHITTVNGHHVSIPLPVILYSKESGFPPRPRGQLLPWLHHSPGGSEMGKQDSRAAARRLRHTPA